MLVKRGIACVQLAHATRQPIEVQLLAETAPVVLLVCSVRMHATICFLFWSSLCVCLYVLMLYSNTCLLQVIASMPRAPTVCVCLRTG